MRLRRRRQGRRRFRAHPATDEVVKFLPNNPPRRGSIVLVNGARCRVVRTPAIGWRGREWRILSSILVEELPLG